MIQPPKVHNTFCQGVCNISIAIDKQWPDGLNLCSIGMPCKTVESHLRSADLLKSVAMGICSANQIADNNHKAFDSLISSPTHRIDICAKEVVALIYI